MTHLFNFPSTPLFSGNRYAAWATTVLLSALLGFLGWNSRSEWYTATTTQSVALPAPLPKTQVSAETIAEAHLFGAPPLAANAAVQPSLPSSWHVIGIVAGSSPDQSMADIAIDGVEHIWHVGDRLPDSSILIAIDGNSVTTSRGGSGALLPFELRPISHDDHFETLSLGGDGPSLESAGGIVPTPAAHPIDPGAVADRLAALRAAGVAEWVKRTQVHQPSPPPQPPAN